MKINPNRFLLFFLMVFLFSTTTFAENKTRYTLKNKNDDQILTEQLTELISSPEMEGLDADKIQALYEVQDPVTAQAVLELVQQYSNATVESADK